MLTGEFHHTLDPKGRVFVPARWREELGKGGGEVIVTKGLEGCLYVMTKENFAARGEEIEQSPLSSKAMRDYLRLYFSGSSEETIDRQGRMNIPAPLRAYAGLDKDVVLIGVSSRGEIWSEKAWNPYKDEVEERYEAIAEELTNPAAAGSKGRE